MSVTGLQMPYSQKSARARISIYIERGMQLWASLMMFLVLAVALILRLTPALVACSAVALTVIPLRSSVAIPVNQYFRLAPRPAATAAAFLAASATPRRAA